jgi:hypothetical protein
MKFSWKIPIKFQIQKYLSVNIERYLMYLDWVQGVSWKKLKFMDESHFIEKNLGQRKVLGLRNCRRYMRFNDLHQPHATLTILIGMNEKLPIYCDYCEDSNNQYDFFNFVTDAINDNALCPEIF